MIEILNAQWFARCAELGIIPPIGKAGPPPQVEDEAEVAA